MFRGNSYRLGSTVCSSVTVGWPQEDCGFVGWFPRGLQPTEKKKGEPLPKHFQGFLEDDKKEGCVNNHFWYSQYPLRFVRPLFIRLNRIYYEWMKWESKIRPMYECRWDERLNTEVEEDTRLGHTGFLGELEHPKKKTRLIVVDRPRIIWTSVCFLWMDESRDKDKCLLLIDKVRVKREDLHMCVGVMKD